MRSFLFVLLLLLAVNCPLASPAKESSDLFRKASVLYSEGKYEEALKTAREVLADAEKKYGEQNLELADPLMLLAEIQQGRRAFHDAAEYLERLRSIQESNMGPRSTKVSRTISELIAVYEKSGDSQKAENLNEIAYDRWSKQRPVRQVVAKEPEPPKTHSLKDIENYAKIMVILADYRKKHTYSMEDFFVCADMTIDIWNILKTHGINSKIMVGNVERDIRLGTSDPEYIAKMNHSWILAEVKPNEWIPLETTGGYIVDPKSNTYDLYLKGISFDNPRGFKDFSDMRKSYYMTCREANKVADAYNSQYAGKLATQESLEYRGRALQKHEECKSLAEGVLAHLRR